MRSLPWPFWLVELASDGLTFGGRKGLILCLLVGLSALAPALLKATHYDYEDACDFWSGDELIVSFGV